MTAEYIIDQLGLKPHPEGGWYIETHKDSGDSNGRPDSSVIYFLLKEGETAHWHRITDADEVWSWHAGATLSLYTKIGDAPVVTNLLGMDIENGATPQLIIQRDTWQSASANEGWVLVSNIVAPAFDFEGMELAPRGFEPGFGI